MICAFVVILLLVQCEGINIDQVSESMVNGIIGDPQYNLKTSDTNLGMDCLKIGVDPATQRILGVFHHVNQQTRYSQLYVAQMNKQSKKWASTKKISERGSQGSMLILNGTNNGIFIIYELENHEHGNRVAIRYYDSLLSLFNNFYWYEYQLSAKIASVNVVNVGTPDIQEVFVTKQQSQKQFNQYRLYIKFHYSPDGSHDYPGDGTVNIYPLRDFVKDGKWVGGSLEKYSDWTGVPDKTIQGLLRQAGCPGKIGQRDYFFLGNTRYYLYQCNLNPDFDWKSWRIFLVSLTEKRAKMIPFNFDGAYDLANPHISLMSQSEKKYVFAISVFIPSEAITPQTSAQPGQCLFYTQIDL